MRPGSRIHGVREMRRVTATPVCALLPIVTGAADGHLEVKPHMTAQLLGDGGQAGKRLAKSIAQARQTPIGKIPAGSGTEQYGRTLTTPGAGAPEDVCGTDPDITHHQSVGACRRDSLVKPCFELIAINYIAT